MSKHCWPGKVTNLLEWSRDIARAQFTFVKVFISERLNGNTLLIYILSPINFRFVVMVFKIIWICLLQRPKSLRKILFRPVPARRFINYLFLICTVRIFIESYNMIVLSTDRFFPSKIHQKRSQCSLYARLVLIILLFD